MRTNRRTFLRSSGLLAVLFGTGVAGCLDSIGDDTEETGDTTSYREWLLDPASIADPDIQGFGSIDVQSVRENIEHLPPELEAELDIIDEEVESINVDEFERVTGVGYEERDSSANGASIVAEGSFDPDAFADELREEEDDLEDRGEYKGYQVYGEEGETWGGDPQSGAIGFDENTVVVGVTERTELTGQELLEATITAHADGDARYYDASADAAAIIDEVGGQTVSGGVEFTVDPSEALGVDDSWLARAVLDSLSSVGWGMNIQGDTTRNTAVLVYDDADDADAEVVEDLVDMYEEHELMEYVGDVSVREEGRTVVATADVQTEDLWEDATGDEAVDTGSDTDQLAPQATFEMNQTDAGELEIRHLGGDTIRAEDPLLVQYTEDGEEREEEWSGEVVAGESITIGGADSGTVVLLVWQDTSTGNSEVIHEFVVE